MDCAAATPSPGGTVGGLCGSHHSTPAPSKSQHVRLRSDTVRRRGRKPGRTGGRRRRREPPPPPNPALPSPTQTAPHQLWDIHEVGLANKNRTTVETSKYTIPTRKRLIFKKLLQTQGKRPTEKVKPTRVIKITPIKKSCNRNIKKINENLLNIFGHRSNA